MKQMSCDGVDFYLHIPKDFYSTPYLLLASIGAHSHPPPPIHRTPQRIIDDLIRTIKRVDQNIIKPGTSSAPV
jgi:hypothetical protein